MYYTNGNYSMGGNFKIKKQAPMDDRSTVAKKIDLQNPNLFDGFTYNGMIVSVVDDTINNGIYRLEDKSTKTWVKEGNPNTGGTTGDYYTKSETYSKVETDSLLDTKQDSLVSGTNIKTINGQSVLGSGGINLEGLSELPSPKVGVEVLTPYRCPVNGKPFYSKIIDCGFIPALANHYWEKDIGISNPETTIDFITPDYPNSFVHVPNYGAFSFGMPQTWHAVGHNISFYVDNYKIAIGTANATNNNKKLYCAIKYTKTADTVNSPVALVGSAKRGLPGPKGQDGTVAFSDLSEEQKEELTRNKYVRVRESNNFLYYNKSDNTAYLDIAPSQNLRIESMKVKTEEDAEYDIPTTQVIDEPNEIGEYRYINIDYKTDIFEDGSGIVHFPLSTGLTSIDGVHTFVPSEPDFNNPMFTMDNINDVSKSTLDGRTNNATLACDTLTAVLPNKTNTCYSIFLKQNSTQSNNFFMIRELGFMLHSNWIYIRSPELNNDGWIDTTKIPNGTWMHIVANIKNDVLASDYYVNGVKFPVERRVKVEIPGPVYPIAKLMTSPSVLQVFSFRVFNRHLTISEMNTLRTKISYNALEFYHGSGDTLKEAKMVNTTINLPVPKAPNEAGALALGLQKNDLYINSSNGLSIVTTNT